MNDEITIAYLETKLLALQMGCEVRQFSRFRRWAYWNRRRVFYFWLLGMLNATIIFSIYMLLRGA